MSVSSLKFVMHEALPYIWWKHHIQLLPQDQLAHEAVDAAWRAVHVETFLVAHEWEPYLRRHFKRMSTNQVYFGRYTLFALYLEFHHLVNPYDRFIRVIAVAAYFSIYCHTRGKPHGIALVPRILEMFINREMSDLPDYKDFWTNFSNHVIRKGYLKHHLDVDKMLRRGRSRQDILKVIAKDSTIDNLVKNSQERASIDPDHIEGDALFEDMVRSLQNIVYQPESHRYSVKKLSMPQKLDVASRLRDDLIKVQERLFGFDRYLKKASDSLVAKEKLNREMLEAPLMEVVPEEVLLNCLFNMKDYL